MILTGFADEVSSSLKKQIEVCKALDWKYIDLRTIGKENVCHLKVDQFDSVLEQLEESELKISCFGSSIANWDRNLDYSLKDEIRELQHAARLMRKADVRYIRIMSYAVPEYIPVFSPEGKQIAGRLKILAEAAEDEGILLLHENCETWGGQSREHTMFLLEEVNSPSFRLIFDTGNPPGSPDVVGKPPYKYQDGLAFIKGILSSVDLIHIKDAVIEREEIRYMWPGEGDGRVSEILFYLYKKKYDGFFSIEPHLSVIYHDQSVKASEVQRWNSFVEYGRRTESLLRQAGYPIPFGLDS